MSIAFIQNRNGYQASGASFTTSAFGSNPTTGNTIVVAVIGRGAAGNPAFGVSDNHGNTYTSAISGLGMSGSDFFRIEIFYCSNITGGAAHTITVTTSTSNDVTVSASEYSGMVTSGALGNFFTNSANSSSPNVSVDVATSGNVVIAAISQVGATSDTPPGGWAERSTNMTAVTTLSVVDKALAGAGTATWTLNASADWIGLSAEFVAAAVPLAAGTVSISAIATTTATYSIASTTGGTSPYTYQFEQAPDVSGSPGTYANAGSNSSSTSYNATGLSPNTKYWVRCTVTDNVAATSVATAVSFTTPTYTFLQETHGDHSGSASYTTSAFGSSTITGHLIVVIATAKATTTPTLTVTDSKGNVYTPGPTITDSDGSGNSFRIQLFYKANATGGSSHTVTATASVSSTLAVAALEYAGVRTTAALGHTATNQGHTNSPNTGAVATTVGNLMVAAESEITSDQTTIAGTGWTARTNDISGVPSLVTEDRVANSSTMAALFGLSGIDFWDCVLAEFSSSALTTLQAGTVAASAIGATTATISISGTANGTPAYTNLFQIAPDVSGAVGTFADLAAASTATSVSTLGLSPNTKYWIRCTVIDTASGQSTSDLATFTTTRAMARVLAGLTFNEGADLAFGTTTGTRIGTDPTQKIGFYGVTPVVQAAAPTAPNVSTPVSSDATIIANLQTRVTHLENACKSLGIVAT